MRTSVLGATRALTVALAVALAAAAGCTKGADPTPAPAPVTAPKTPPPPSGPPTAPAPGFDGKALVARLQGAWLVGGGSLGTVEAWRVTGAQALVWNGAREAHVTVRPIAPCQLALEETAMDGSRATSFTTVAIDGDQVYAGLGLVAVPDAGGWIVCGGDGVYTLRKGECVHWKRELFGDTWEPSPGQCKLDGEGVAAVLSITERGTTVPLAPRGGLFATEQFAASLARALPDWDAAKAAVGPTGAPATPATP